MNINQNRPILDKSQTNVAINVLLSHTSVFLSVPIQIRPDPNETVHFVELSKGKIQWDICFHFL